MTLLRQRMLEDLHIRNYSSSTVECYIREVAAFAKHFGKSPEHLGPEQIRSWQLFLLNEKKAKISSYIQAVCALRFLYRNTLNRKIEIEQIPLPRFEKKLPVILSKEEVPRWSPQKRPMMVTSKPANGNNQNKGSYNVLEGVPAMTI